MPADSKSRSRLIDRIRERIFNDLGCECAVADEHPEPCDGPLTIDHPNGREGWPKPARKLSSYQRWLRYLHEHEQQRIRLLCNHHNNIIRPKPLAYDPARQPF